MIETAQVASSIKQTLVEHGLNVQTITIVPTSVATAPYTEVQWRVDVAFVGEPIVISHSFVVAMGIGVAALGGVHGNSLWQLSKGLVVVSRVLA